MASGVTYQCSSGVDEFVQEIEQKEIVPIIELYEMCHQEGNTLLKVVLTNLYENSELLHRRNRRTTRRVLRAIQNVKKNFIKIYYDPSSRLGRRRLMRCYDEMQEQFW